MSSQPLQLRRWQGGAWQEAADEVATEEPLEIRVEGHTVSITMRTPGHDRELAAGSLFTAGLLAHMGEVFDLTTCVPSAQSKGNAVDVGLADPGRFQPERWARPGVVGSSCGVCGSRSLEQALRAQAPLPETLRLRPETLLALPAKLAAGQETFRRTGGLHACALFSAGGELQEVREDVGRHNALDKLIGWAFLGRHLPLSESILLLSGRVSFEMVQKAQAAGVQVVAAISAPSSLAVRLAEEANQTLVGFLREETMNVYAGAQRILGMQGE